MEMSGEAESGSRGRNLTRNNRIRRCAEAHWPLSGMSAEGPLHFFAYPRLGHRVCLESPGVWGTAQDHAPMPQVRDNLKEDSYFGRLAGQADFAAEDFVVASRPFWHGGG